jgi:hypothetical protein
LNAPERHTKVPLFLFSARTLNQHSSGQTDRDLTVTQKHKAAIRLLF